MKKFLKTFGVLLLGLFTLVSCNRYIFINTYDYETKQEIKESLGNATFIDDKGKTGVYMFKEDGEIKPDVVKYRLETYADRNGRKNMTKENPIIKRDAFRVTTFIGFNRGTDRLVEQYAITATNEDSINVLENLKDYKVDVNKIRRQTHDEYRNDVAITYEYVDDNGKKTNKNIVVVSSNLNVPDIEDFCYDVLKQLEYVQVGK